MKQKFKTIVTPDTNYNVVFNWQIDFLGKKQETAAYIWSYLINCYRQRAVDYDRNPNATEPEYGIRKTYEDLSFVLRKHVSTVKEAVLLLAQLEAIFIEKEDGYGNMERNVYHLNTDLLFKLTEEHNRKSKEPTVKATKAEIYVGLATTTTPKFEEFSSSVTVPAFNERTEAGSVTIPEAGSVTIPYNNILHNPLVVEGDAASPSGFPNDSKPSAQAPKEKEKSSAQKEKEKVHPYRQTAQSTSSGFNGKAYGTADMVEILKTNEDAQAITLKFFKSDPQAHERKLKEFATHCERSLETRFRSIPDFFDALRILASEKLLRRG